MVQKRPFDNEELYDVSSKHPRHLQLVSILEFVPSDDASRQVPNLGKNFLSFTVRNACLAAFDH